MLSHLYYYISYAGYSAHNQQLYIVTSIPIENAVE